VVPFQKLLPGTAGATNASVGHANNTSTSNDATQAAAAPRRDLMVRFPQCWATEKNMY